MPLLVTVSWKECIRGTWREEGTWSQEIDLCLYSCVGNKEFPVMKLRTFQANAGGVTWLSLTLVLKCGREKGRCYHQKGKVIV